MKLIIAIAHERDKHKLGDALLQNGLTFTKLGSTGGFLRQGNVTVLIGVEDDDAPRVLDIIKEACRSSEGYVNLPGRWSAASRLWAPSRRIRSASRPAARWPSC